MKLSRERLLIFLTHLALTCLFVVLFWYLQRCLLKVPASLISHVVKILLALLCADLIVAFLRKRRKGYSMCADYSYNSRIYNLIERYSYLHSWVIYSFGLVFYVLISFSITFIAGDDADAGPMVGQSILYMALLGLFAAPLFETFFFQYLIIETGKLITRLSTGASYVIFSGIVSAILFGVFHNYSIGYVLVMSFFGLYLSFTYIFFCVKYRSKLRAFWATAMLHFLCNLLPFSFAVADSLFQ